MKKIPQILSLWLPVVVYISCIFYLSSIPNPFYAFGGPPAPDYILHGVEYGLLSFLLARAFAGGFARFPTTFEFVIVFLAGTTVGILDEILQSFALGRFSTLQDVFADAIGAVAGILVFCGAVKIFKYYKK